MKSATCPKCFAEGDLSANVKDGEVCRHEELEHAITVAAFHAAFDEMVAFESDRYAAGVAAWKSPARTK
jgi:hypothetical protein